MSATVAGDVRDGVNNRTVERERQDFIDAAWGVFPPGTHSMGHNVHGVFIDPIIQKMWEVWKIRAGI